MNKHIRVTSHLPADRKPATASPSVLRTPPLRYCLTTCISLFILGLFIQPLHAVNPYKQVEGIKRKYFEYAPIVEGYAGPEGNTSNHHYHRYTPNLSIRVQRENMNRFRWEFAFSAIKKFSPDTLHYTPVQQNGQNVRDIKFFVKDVINPNQPGYYFFRYVKEGEGPPIIRSPYARIEVLANPAPNAAPVGPPPVQPLPQNLAPEIISNTVSPNSPASFVLTTPIAGAPDEHLFYTIENYDPESILISPPQVILQNGEFIGPQRIQINLLKATRIKVTVSRGGAGHLLTTYHLQAIEPDRLTLLLYNANDSNGNHNPDYLDGLFVENAPVDLPPNTPSDPELFRVNFFSPGHVTPNLSIMVADNFFQIYAGYKIKLNATPGLRLWANQFRSELATLEYEVNPANAGAIFNWLTTSIYVEGVQPSQKDGEQEVWLELTNGEPPLHLAQRVFTVLHLYVNHDRSGIENNGINPAGNINQIVNPAVIPVVTPQNDDEIPQKCGIFELSSSNPDLLKKYAPQIQWRVHTLQEVPQPRLVELNGNIPPSTTAHGWKIGIIGVAPSTIQIDIGFPNNPPYISFYKLAVPIRHIGVNFQFFESATLENRDPRIDLIASRVPFLLGYANIIARQAGIEFHQTPAVGRNGLQRVAMEELPLPHEYQTHTIYTSFLHVGIPDRITSKGGWAYAPALSYYPNSINVNFVAYTSDFSPKLSGIVPPNNNLVHELPTEERNIVLTTHPRFNAIPQLTAVNIASTTFPIPPTWANLQENNERNFVRLLVKSMLRTLGLLPHGHNDDLSYYKTTPEVAALAFETKTLWLTNDLSLIINPISPATDFLPLANHPVENNKNILSLKTGTNANSIKINSSQAILLHLHPFTYIPAQ